MTPQVTSLNPSQHISSRKVEHLRSFTPEDLRAFAARVLCKESGRRKVIVAVVGSGESKIAEGTVDSSLGSSGKDLAAAFTALEPTRVVSDFSSFKRGCEVFPNVSALYKQLP